MSKQNLVRLIILLGLIPLFLALFFALHFYFNWDIVSGNRKNFARINSYIYTHYTAALLLIMMAGIQIGRVLDRGGSSLYILFNLLLFVVIWFSYRSFADFNGILLIFIAWAAAFVLDINANNNEIYPSWFSQLKFKFNGVALTLIGLVLIINR